MPLSPRQKISIILLLLVLGVALIYIVSGVDPKRPTVTSDPASSQPVAAAACTVQLSAGASIQAALDGARPGTVICLAPGSYEGKLTTKVAGEPGNPIIIRGTDEAKDPSLRHRTVLYGTGRIVNIDHSHYTLEGFSVDGQRAITDYPQSPGLDEVVRFKDSQQSVQADGRLVYIGSSETSRDITGVTIRNMYLRGAGGECIRIRNNARGNLITDSVIEWCGMFKKDGTYHNGEGVYIGTSPKSTSQPMYANDQSSLNIVRDNIINTHGSECFDVKENAHSNSFYNNICSSNIEPGSNGSNVELRGIFNCVTRNTISHSLGVNIKLKSDSSRYDKSQTVGPNVIINNDISDATSGAYTAQQAVMVRCENRVEGVRESACTQANLAKLPPNCPYDGVIPTIVSPPPTTLTPTITQGPTMTLSPTITGCITPSPSPTIPAGVSSTPTSTPGPQTGSTFLFTTQGDYGDDFGTGSRIIKNFEKVRELNTTFHIGLGDYMYADNAQESLFTDAIKSTIGSKFPFMWVTGDHDNTVDPGGLIQNFVAQLPNRLTSQTTLFQTNTYGPLPNSYGAEYYFDYPTASPYARFIIINPSNAGNLPDSGYAKGEPVYEWTKRALNDARTRGYRWVVAAMHKPCVSVGTKGECDVGQDVYELLLGGVTGVQAADFILHGHEHAYNRSYQVALGPACTIQSFIGNTFNTNCIKNTQKSGYTAGQGTVILVNGLGGRGFRGRNAADDSVDIKYFAEVYDQTSCPKYGISAFTVGRDRVDYRFHNTSSVSGTCATEDTFTFTASAPQATRDLMLVQAALPCVQSTPTSSPSPTRPGQHTPTPSSQSPTPTRTVTPNPSQTPLSPTLTISPTRTPTPTVRPTPQPVALTILIKSQGFSKLYSRPRTQIDVEVVLHDVKKDRKTSPFAIEMNHKGEGVYAGIIRTTTDTISPQSEYHLLVSWPKHLTKRYCTATQKICKPTDVKGRVVTAGAQSFDLTYAPLIVGDIAVDGVQDGVIDSYDMSFVRSHLTSQEQSILDIADLNDDGIIDTQDYLLIIATGGQNTADL